MSALSKNWQVVRYGALGKPGLPSWLAVSLLTVLAGVLSFLYIGEKSLWEDEGSSWVFAHGNLRAGLDSDPNMSLYYLLLHFWLRLGAESEAAIRSLSAVFIVLTIPMIYLLGARLFGRLSGLLAALTLAVNAFVIEYAQEARAYSLVLFLVTTSSYFFVVELERPSRVSRAGFLVSTALAMYAHFFAAYVVLVQLLTLLVVRRRAAIERRWLLGFAALFVVWLPAAAQAIRFGHSTIAWIPRPTLSGLWHASVLVAGGSWGLLVLVLVAAAWLALGAVRAGDEKWQTGFVLVWLLLPPLLSFLLSLVVTMFWPTYLIVGVPAVALTTGAAIARAPSRLLAGLAAVAVLLALSGLRLNHWYAHSVKEDWRDATRFVLQHEHPGDRVVFYVRNGANPFGYYAYRAGRPGPQPLNVFSTAVAPGGRIWFVRLHALPTNPIIHAFLTRVSDAGYQLVNTTSFVPRAAAFDVALYERHP